MRRLHPEAFSFAVDVAQAEVHVRPDPLHGLDGQGATQVLRIGSGGRQPEAEPVHGAGLVAAVGDVVEEVVHAWILSTLLSCAEVVIHDFVQIVVLDSTPAV